MRRFLLSPLTVVWFLLGVVAFADPPTADPLDWPYCRGPRHNQTSLETGLPDSWNPSGGEGSNLAWKRADFGGRSTPVVMNGKLYTLCRANPETATEGERVVCVDVATGKTVWENKFNIWLSDVPDTRVGWSAVTADPETGYVYALGVCGFFQCIHGETGKTVWSAPLHEQFGLLSTYGGRTNFPIIHEDLVIVSAVVIGWGDMARPAHRFIAFDKRSGKVVWFNGTNPLPEDTTYSAPVYGVFNGQKAMVFGSGDGSIWAFQPRTGKRIWEYKFALAGVNASPLVVGNTVYAAHSEENFDAPSVQGSVVAINGVGKGNITKSNTVWKINESIMMGRSSPIELDGKLYCFDDRAKLSVMDAKSGEVLSPKKSFDTVMRGTPLLADGKFYVFTMSRWHILQPDGKGGVKSLSSGRFPTGVECHGSPICSHGRIFMQTNEGLYCFQDPNKTPGVNAAPAAPEEDPLEKDQVPALVQVVPAELLVKPGETAKFDVKLFNAKGQFLQASPAQFTLQGPGQISDDGTFTAPADAAHVATLVTAKVGEVTGLARVRIVPPLPWSFDFEKGAEPPVTWVGARYRHVIRKVGDQNVMVKVTTIPKGTRSRCWFGPTDLHDYTIEADVRGSLKDNKMPDIGLIAQGYEVDLQGAHQQLLIRMWGTQEKRTSKFAKYKWEPNKWYSLKFKASTIDANESKKVLLQGKVWPRGEPEPATWTVEIEDSAPNLTGAPGLFGNAKDAEIFLDNIKVTQN